MSIRIPDDATCIVPGCAETPTNSISIRLRRQDTSAVWAPECHAYVCDPHGLLGADIDIIYKPRADGKINTRVQGSLNPRPAAERETVVRA